jgi:ribosomal protein L7/L12
MQVTITRDEAVLALGIPRSAKIRFDDEVPASDRIEDFSEKKLQAIKVVRTMFPDLSLLESKTVVDVASALLNVNREILVQDLKNLLYPENIA